MHHVSYTRNIDFNDTAAKEYLENLLSPAQVLARLENRDVSMFYHPYFA